MIGLEAFNVHANQMMLRTQMSRYMKLQISFSSSLPIRPNSIEETLHQVVLSVTVAIVLICLVGNQYDRNLALHLFHIQR